MIRFLNRIAARWLNRAARDHRNDQRQAVKSKAQSMRIALGLPELEILN